MTNEIESLTTDLSTRRTGSGASPLWVAFAVVALVLAIYAHWRFNQFDERIDRLHRQTTGLRTAQDKVRSDVGSLVARLEQSNEQFRDEIRTLREMSAQVGELGQSVAELRARTEAPQRAWVRAEALYLLELAGRRLRLEHDVPTAIAAMESADARLATVTDPAVTEVRAQLARELAALRAVNVPDVPSVIARLTTLEAQSVGFRVLGVPVAKPRRVDADGGVAKVGAFDRAMWRLVQAWRDLFSYRRVDPAASRLVTGEEESLRRQHFELLLFAARIAAMQQDRQAYVQSLRAAMDWIDRFFDVRDDSVASARAELMDLAAIDVDPARPETGTAAQLLQRVIRANAPARVPPPGKP
jgi:uroporphyrin-3 C-methyltransferase